MGSPGRPRNRAPWRWLLVCATALTVASGCVAAGAPTGHGTHGSNGEAPAQTRTYFVGADVVTWNYVPARRNELTGRPFDAVADTWVKRGPDRIGPRYLKCVYRGYPDATFSRPSTRPPEERHLGLLGPVIRAAVGDTVRVVFRNACPFPATVHAHGVFYPKGAEGAAYADGTTGRDRADDAVPTGGRHTYVWQVPERAGPAAHDGSSVMWMYHSHAHEVADMYAGLMGPIVVTGRGHARPDGSPSDIDREVFALFSVIDENKSPFLAANARRFAGGPPPDGDPGFEESNLKHAINGYVFGNMPLVDLRRGTRVRWYVMSMGTEVDLHTPHWHGNTVTVAGMRMDTVSLLPATMAVADMIPDDPGIWLFHCHVADHITAGMSARYEVR
jgi:FtsP/CotA-like multicopper oxidase with cupredoxin domain